MTRSVQTRGPQTNTHTQTSRSLSCGAFVTSFGYCKVDFFFFSRLLCFNNLVASKTFGNWNKKKKKNEKSPPLFHHSCITQERQIHTAHAFFMSHPRTSSPSRAKIHSSAGCKCFRRPSRSDILRDESWSSGRQKPSVALWKKIKNKKTCSACSGPHDGPNHCDFFFFFFYSWVSFVSCTAGWKVRISVKVWPKRQTSHFDLTLSVHLFITFFVILFADHSQLEFGLIVLLRFHWLSGRSVLSSEWSYGCASFSSSGSLNSAKYGSVRASEAVARLSGSSSNMRSSTDKAERREWRGRRWGTRTLRLRV